MSSIDDVKVTAELDCNPCTAWCGGLGCIRQESSGTGTVFYAAGGTILQKTLAPGETVVTDALSIVGFQETVKFGVKPSGGCGGLCCGGEGLCYGTLTGPGVILIQSMPFEKYVANVSPPAQNQPEGGQDGQMSG
eukprot:CAMPEP_0174821404 /NCGR_PEP_ID=MMETSP1107-20130205/7643_1 /TAXON_ID=36770 /ORGANISM="Paraphysomonas vestita, Strain GFlagA" /LENGTH=134 /DNA_ID=CAMNT_0016038381 /DNA_START=424 /DNA_END=828 /DNA_ORIENTATION=+